MEADHVEGGQKQPLGAKQRLHDGKPYESRVGKYQRKLGDLALVQITKALAKNKGHDRHEGVKHHAKGHDNESVCEIFVGKFCLNESRNDHQRLSDLDDQRRQALGGHVVNDVSLASKESASHEQKQSGYDGEESRKIHAWLSFQKTEILHLSFPFQGEFFRFFS